MEYDIRKSLVRILSPKLERLGISNDELGNHFDLVKSGLVNSLEFVDMVATLEKEYHCEVDFEKGLAEGDLTTIGGLIKYLREE
jgi:acyl carrier protein